MIQNLSLGTVVIMTTALVHTFGLIFVTHLIGVVTSHLRLDGRRSRIVAMLTTVLGIFAVLSVEVWIWALAFLALGISSDLEGALYFSLVTFSTVGYGDLVPPHAWRIFVALEGVNGFLLIGWSTAYLIAAGMRVGPFRAGEHF
jgi:hypothetical protein